MPNNKCCDETEIINSNPNEDDVLIELAEIFKIFGDSTRIKIIHCLLEKDLCVCDISNKLSMTSSAISHQLRILRANKLVKFRKSGKSVIYSLDDAHVREIFTLGLEHIREGGYRHE